MLIQNDSFAVLNRHMQTSPPRCTYRGFQMSWRQVACVECSSHFQTQYQVTIRAGSSGKGEREAIWGVGGAGEAGGKEYICKYLWFTCLSGPVWKVCVCVCLCMWVQPGKFCVCACMLVIVWMISSSIDRTLPTGRPVLKYLKPRQAM